MSRFTGGFRQSADDLAYGEAPQRWDRDRFDRFGRGPPPPPGPPRGSNFEEDYRFRERDYPGGGRSVAIAEHVETRSPPPARFDERERIYQDTFGEPRGGRRRTDRELFGEVDPRELAEMALTPYRRKSITRDIDVDRSTAPPRPGLMRRQSSLDTFDRRPVPRFERDAEYRMPPYQPVPLPIRRDPREHDFEEIRYRDAEPENYREVEIKRERSVHRRSGRAKSHKSSKAASTVRSASTSSSSSSSFQEIEKVSSASPERKVGRKGKTRMPKRLVHRDAIHDLAYPYDEEEDFFVLRIALDKEQIDEVIKISEMYKTGDKKTVYRFDEHIHETPAPPPEDNGHEEIIRKEYINPPSNYVPSNAGRSSHHSHSHHRSRAGSPSSASTVTRRLSPARTERSNRDRGRSIVGGGTVFEERRTVVEEQGRAPTVIYPPAPPQGEFFEDRRTVIEERSPHNSGALIVQEREPRSHRDIEAEIRALEAERRALRLEREAEERQGLAVRLRERPEEDFQVVEYREQRPREEILRVVEREKSPPRNVLRVEKDRKAEKKREKRAKSVALAMATLT